MTLTCARVSSVCAFCSALQLGNLDNQCEHLVFLLGNIARCVRCVSARLPYVLGPSLVFALFAGSPPALLIAVICPGEQPQECGHSHAPAQAGKRVSRVQRASSPCLCSESRSNLLGLTLVWRCFDVQLLSNYREWCQYLNIRPMQDPDKATTGLSALCSLLSR